MSIVVNVKFNKRFNVIRSKIERLWKINRSSNSIMYTITSADKERLYPTPFDFLGEGSDSARRIYLRHASTVVVRCTGT